jgi:Mevalonate 5-diphosphate decarboxylase C-terminal domain
LQLPSNIGLNCYFSQIINYVHEFNRLEGETKVCYTFDAGPNACLYVLEKNVKRVLSFINYAFPNEKQGSVEYVRGIPVDQEKEVSSSHIPSLFHQEIFNAFCYFRFHQSLVKYLHMMLMLSSTSFTQKSVKGQLESSSFLKSSDQQWLLDTEQRQLFCLESLFPQKNAFLGQSD